MWIAECLKSDARCDTVVTSDSGLGGPRLYALLFFRGLDLLLLLGYGLGFLSCF
jgi:hypothetical protein